MADADGNSTISPATASAPFDNGFGDADIIFRSADSTDFYLHKNILRMASAFFGDMFSLPQPGNPDSLRVESSKSASLIDLQVVSVTEEAQVFDLLLRFCYPTRNPALTVVQDTASLLTAALKYQMEDVIPVANESLVTLCVTEPLRVYAVACEKELEDVALVAARSFSREDGQRGATWHNYPIDSYVPEMDNISALSYFRLLKYYRADADGKASFESQRGEDTFCSFSRLIPPSQTARSLPPRSTAADDQDVSLPFQDLSSGDIIIQSSDGIDFHVHRQVLTLASPVWNRLLSDEPESNPNNSDRTASRPFRQTFSMLESTSTLSVLLQLCYPMPDPPLRSSEHETMLSEARCVLDAATRLQIPRAVDFARKVYASLLEHKPMSVYLTAMCFSWEKEANDAALHAVYQNVDYEVGEMSPTATAGVYRRLLTYRKKCREAILSQFYKPSANTDADVMYWNGHPAARATESWLTKPDDAHFWLSVHNCVRQNVASRRPVTDIGPVLHIAKMLKPFADVAMGSSYYYRDAENVHRSFEQKVTAVAEALAKVSEAAVRLSVTLL